MPTKHTLSGGGKLIVVGVLAIVQAISSNSIQAQIPAGAPESPATFSCVTPPSGLVSWWTAEGNGNDLVNSNNGALLNGAGFAGGKVGQSFSFNGSGAHVRVKDAPNLRFTTGLTIETWVNPASSGTDHQIVSKWDAIVGINQRCYGLSIWGDGRAYLGISTDGLHLSGTTAEAFSISTVPTNQWTHIVGTYDGTAIKIYLNGVLEGTTPLGGSIFPGTNDLAIGGAVGGLSFGDLIRPFDGLIDEVSLYNRPLSAAEIQAIFSAGSAGKCQGSAPGSSGTIWAVNFFADKNPGLGTVKHGFAAIGHTTNDVWNGCSRDGATMFDFLTFVAVSNLVTVDGSVTEVNLTLTNAPGAWFNGTDDAMYNTYLYPFDGGNLVVEVSNLPVGAYDFYVYGHGNVDQGGMHDLNGVYQLSSGGVDYGTKSTATTGTNWQTTSWMEGEQYVVFRGVMVAGGQKVVLTGLPGAGGEALIAGLQILAAGGPVALAPVITNQPASQAVAVGTTVNFNVGVTGTEPLSYQWKFNGTNISGGTDSSLTLSNVQLSAAGNYSVLVSNTAGSTNSSNAVLTVNPPCSSAPTGIISWWPGDGNADDMVGGNAGTVLSGAVFAAGKVGQAFRFNGSGAHVRVKDAPNLHLTTAFSLEAWFFRQGTGPAIQAILDKWDAAPGFNQRSYGISLHDNLATFGGSSDGVNADGVILSTGTIPINQWVHMVGTYDGATMRLYLNGVLNNSVAFTKGFFPGTNDFAIGGEVGGLAPGNAISTFQGLIDEPTVYSRALTSNEVLTIYNAGASGKCQAPARPIIVTQPANRTVPAGTSVSFSVAATGSTPIHYQWRYNSGSILGATNSSLTLSNVQVSQSGNYSVFVSNAVGATNSSNAVLMVVPVCLAPPTGIVGWWPGESNANDLIGGNAGKLLNGVTFAAGKAGQAFNLNGTGAHIRIPVGPNLRVTNGLTAEAWIFPTAVGGGVQRAVLTKWDAVPGFNQRSFGIGLDADGTANVGISTDGLNTSGSLNSTNVLPTNQWSHLAGTYDGTTLKIYVNGVLNNTLAVSGSIFPGTNDLAIGGTVGGAPSGTVLIPFAGLIDEATIYSRALTAGELLSIFNAGASGKCQTPAPPVITLQPASRTVPAGTNVTFNVAAIGATPLGYQWKFNGTNIGSGTNASLTLSNVQVSQSGNYSVFVSNMAGSTNSSNAVLTVNPVSPNCVTPPAGVVSWWAAESNANDSVGINHGVLKNGAGFNTGQVGQAFSINGVNQYVEVPPSASFNPPGSFTLEAWIFPLPQTINRTIMGKWSDTGDYANSRCFILTVTAVNALGFGISDAAHQDDTVFHTFDTTNNAIATNVWTHVAAVYDQSTGTRRMYVNGVNVANRTNTPITVLGANIKLSIGARMSSSTAAVDFFAGRIDEAAIYQRALSGSEIQAIYSAGASGKCPAAPMIVSQPQNQTVFAGTTAGFAVGAGGSAPLGYQWRFNGTNLSGATNASLSLSNVQLSQTGNYSVLVSNSAGSTNSSNAVLTVLSPGSCFPPPANLVAWWTAEGNANDVSGTNNGVLKNGAGFNTGEVGQAFSLNGVNQYVEVPPSPAFNPSGGFTLEAWIYPLSPSVNRVIMGKWADGGDYQNSRCFIFTVTGVNALGFGISDAAHQTDGSFHVFDTASNTVPLNAWSHVAAVYDQSTGTRRTYINGVKMATRTDAPITVLAANTKLAVGATMASSTSAEAFFAGRIDEASIYQRALSDTEVLALYTAGATGKCPLATPPLITSQPTNLTVPAGSNATFSVTAIGTPPLNYQWKFNGTNINGGTNSSLSLSNVQLSAAGNYSVLVSNSVSSTNSSNAVLTVTPVGPGCLTPPSGIVSWWPGESNANDLIGGNAGVLLNGATFAAGEVSQAFSFNGTGAHVRVKDAPNLHFTNAMTMEAWIFPTSVGGGNDHAIIDKWEAVPSTDERSYGLSLGPDGRVGIGVSADSFNVTGAVYSTNVIPANQWSYVVGTYDGTALRIYVNGVSNNSLAYSAGVFPGTNDFGIGAVVGGAASGTSIARFAGLIDEPAVYNRALSAAEVQAIFNAGVSGKCQVPAPPSIVTHPAGRTVPVGTNVTFNVVAIGATPLGYQWRFGSSNIFGATNSTLTLSNVQVSHSGNYSVFVSNSAGSTNSSNAVLTVLPPSSNCVAAPFGVVSWWPGESNADDLIGGNAGTLFGGATFAAGKVGQAFSLNGTGAHVRVKDAPNLRFGTAITVEGWINPSSTGSDRGIVSKWDAVPAINQRSYGLVIRADGRPAFEVSPDGTITATQVLSTITIPTGQWTHVAGVYDGASLKLYINGASNNTIAYSSGVFAGTGDLGIGGVVGGLANGSAIATFAGLIDEPTVYNRALSSNEVLAIYNVGASGKCQTPAPPSFVAQPVGGTVTAGANVTFLVAAIGATPLNYQWKFNGSNILGATNVTLTLSNVQLGASGNYSVFVSNSVSTTNSSNAVLTVLPLQTNCVASPSGSVSWWPAETNASDIVGLSQGTLVGGAGFAPGKVGQAFSLNGTNQYVRIPNNPSLSPAASFSIEGWINVAAINGQAAILSKWGDAGDYGDKRCYTFTVIPGNALQFGVSDAAHQGDTSFHVFNSTSNLIVPNTWMHVAAVYDQSTGTRRLYVNGTNFAARTDAPITVLNANNDASIGARLSSSTLPVALFPGMIDELTFYSRALTGGEIAAIYSAGTSGKCRPTAPLATSLVVVDTIGAGIVSVPVNLFATGNENSLGFSLNYNATLLNFTGATLGNGTPNGSSLLINSNLLASGKVGIGVGLPANTTFSPGIREVVKLNFLVTSQSNTTTIPVTFGDQPTLRQVSDVLAHAITATYTNGSVTLPFLGLEGDVAPRTNGDGTISITDWVQVGRFVAGLDAAAITPNEFQRADCAPRSTLGDGVLAVADWVQAGRYSVGLDPLTSAGGPVSSGALFNPGGAGNSEGAASTRTITAVGGAGQAGQAFTVPVQLNSLGNENAVGFTATFDSAVLTFTGADLGADAVGATMNVNSDAANTGVVGIALALPIGSTFTAATQELVRLNFTISPTAKDNATVSFASQPVVQQVADANAETLGATYVDASITVLPVVVPPGPTLSIQSSDGNLVITWPVPAFGFQLESTDDLSSGDWNPVTATAVTNAAGVTVTIPTSGTNQFFRLRHP